MEWVGVRGRFREGRCLADRDGGGDGGRSQMCKAKRRSDYPPASDWAQGLIRDVRLPQSTAVSYKLPTGCGDFNAILVSDLCDPGVFLQGRKTRGSQPSSGGEVSRRPDVTGDSEVGVKL